MLENDQLINYSQSNTDAKNIPSNISKRSHCITQTLFLVKH